MLIVVVPGAMVIAQTTQQSSPAPQSNGGASVVVDFASSTSVKSMVGFLDSFTENAPPDSMITPLHPRFMRNPGWGAKGFENRVARAESLGMRPVVIVGGAWKWPHKDMPFANYSVWETFVSDLVKKFNDKKIIWDIWNEPTGDLKKGSETTDQFLESFRRAHDVLRKEYGNDIYLEGPSIGTWDNPYVSIDQFMVYAKANHLKVDGLSWHEILGDESVPAIADHLQQVHKKYIDNPEYAGVGVKDIHINEIIGKYSNYYPGSILAWFYYLEKGGADGACKACWTDDSGEFTCGNSTLDGILVPTTYEPRAAWWAYKYYADGVGSRVSSTSSDNRVVALASKSGKSTGTAQVLVGSFDPGKKKYDQVPVSVSLKNLQSIPFLTNAKFVKVSITRVPNAGLLPVHSVHAERVVTIPADGSTPVTIPDMKLHEMIVLTLSNP